MPHKSHSIRTLFISGLTIAPALRVAAQASCYTGTKQLVGGLPCQPDVNASACCMSGDICYSNGLCQPSAEKLKIDQGNGVPRYSTWYADGCTDPTLKADACASLAFCRQFDNGTANGVTQCPLLGIDVYCCYGFSGCDCKVGEERVFTISSGNPTAITTLPLIPTSSAVLTGTATSTSSLSSSEPGSSSGIFSVTATSTDGQHGSTAAATNGVDSHNSASKSSRKSLPTGLGIGLGLGIPLLAGVIVLVILWTQKAKRTATKSPQPPENQEWNSDYGMIKEPRFPMSAEIQYDQNPLRKGYHPSQHYPGPSQLWIHTELSGASNRISRSELPDWQPNH